MLFYLNIINKKMKAMFTKRVLDACGLLVTNTVHHLLYDSYR